MNKRPSPLCCASVETQADSQKNSHPVVQQHDGDISSILQSFDTITYCKGASVLRMLCHCVGPSRFLEGTRRFVVDHQYACATQEDLWSAVQARLKNDAQKCPVYSILFGIWYAKALRSDLCVESVPRRPGRSRLGPLFVHGRTPSRTYTKAPQT